MNDECNQYVFYFIMYVCELCCAAAVVVTSDEDERGCPFYGVVSLVVSHEDMMSDLMRCGGGSLKQ